MAFFNPFCSQEAISYSNYCILHQSDFTPEKLIKGRMKQATEKVAHKLQTFVETLEEPALPIAQAARKKSCTFGVYPQLGSTAATAGLSRDLVHFLHEIKEGRNTNTTFMAVFTTPSKYSFEAFQKKVEDQLGLLQKVAEPFYCITEAEIAALEKGEQLIAFGGSLLKVTSIYRNTSQGQLKFDYPMLAFSLMQL